MTFEYFSAVLDTAYFSIVTHKNSFSSNIRIRRKEVDLLRQVQESFGGSIGRGPDFYYLNFSGKRCTDIIVGAMPFLRMKVKEAEIILELNRRIASGNTYGVIRGQPLPDQEWFYRQALQDSINALNGKKMG